MMHPPPEFVEVTATAADADWLAGLCSGIGRDADTSGYYASAFAGGVRPY